MDWHKILNTIESFAPIVQAISIVVTAVFASLGLNTWRKQMIGKRKFDVAENILVSMFRMKKIITDIRNPFVMASEIKLTRKWFQANQSQEKEPNDTSLAYLAISWRMSQKNEQIQELLSLRPVGTVLFGNMVDEAISDFNRALNEIAMAANMLYDAASRNETLDKGLATDLRAKIWQANDDDEIAKRLDATVNKVLRVCGAAMK